MGKKILLLCLTVLLTATLVACGNSYSNNYSYDGIIGADSIESSKGIVSNSVSGSWSNNTYIYGDYADYDYTFAAEGTTNKSKKYMLNYYEELQNLVSDNGGYVSNVNNTYTSFIIEPDDSYISDTERCYKAIGQLRFTLQIPNDLVDTITESLEDFCKTNKFTITAYHQRIQNYENYQVVPDGTEIRYSDRDHMIEQSELDRQLAFADFSVTISYYTQRGLLARAGLYIKSIWMSFKEIFGGVTVIIISMGLGLLIIFFEFSLIYKLHKRLVYKHKLKRPEYYTPKEIVIKDKT